MGRCVLYVLYVKNLDNVFFFFNSVDDDFKEKEMKKKDRPRTTIYLKIL